MSDTSTASGNTEHCRALRKDGTPCKAAVLRDGLCFGHQPIDRAARARGGSRRSNAARSVKLLPARLAPIFERMERVFISLDEGMYDRQQATAMATVASVLLKIVQAGELEERVRDLEERVSRSQEPAQWA